MFTFQYGRLKTGQCDRDRHGKYQFTFQYGRLKTNDGYVICAESDFVYIPIWTIKDQDTETIISLPKQVYIPIWTIKDVTAAMTPTVDIVRLHSNMDD